MVWKNVLKDELPEDNQEVLISVHGINYIAIYRERMCGFEIDEHEGFIPIRDVTIYWTEISVPKV
jgi:hypothetical protein